MIEGGIRYIWNKTAANTVASMMGRVMPTMCCGSSGACCALSGCTLTLLLRDCFCLLREFHSDGNEMEYHRYNVSTTIDSNGEIIRSTNDSSFTPRGLMHLIKKTIGKFRSVVSTRGFRTVINLLSIYRIVQQFSSDLGIIHPSYSGSGSEVQPFWEKASSLFTVGHATHLQGTLYGAAYGCFFGIIIPSLRYRKYL